MQLLHANGRPRASLLALARSHHVQAADDITAQNLSEQFQEQWLRKTAHQYQVLGEPPSGEDMTLLKDLHLLDAAPAPAREYDGALLLGGLVVAIRKRLAYLLEQYRNGAKFTTVYLLGGARPLDKDKESPAVLTTAAELPLKAGWTPPADLPTTEAGMMRLVFDQSDLPSEWNGVLVDTPLQPTPDGKTRNPNTTDTVQEFIKSAPKSGTYLAVSSQPFGPRQTINVRQELPEGFTVVGIGYAAAPTTNLKVFLDEVARLLFEEVKRLAPTPEPAKPAAPPVLTEASRPTRQRTRKASRDPVPVAAHSPSPAPTPSAGPDPADATQRMLAAAERLTKESAALRQEVATLRNDMEAHQKKTLERHNDHVVATRELAARVEELERQKATSPVPSVSAAPSSLTAPAASPATPTPPTESPSVKRAWVFLGLCAAGAFLSLALSLWALARG